MTRANLAHRLHDAAEEAAHCTRCPLYRDATQVVFGEGPANAAIMLVGEQPGDKEDLAGQPFVGPAGQVLDRALAEAGLDRAACYVTNAVKHFKHEQRGKFRLHKQPTRGEIQACRWWLDRELEIVRPKLIVALGVTATSSLKGKPVVLSRVRRQILDIEPWRVLATTHPSAILRLRDSDEKEHAFRELVDDLRFALEFLKAP
ncbi:MAG: UdgX family uracil-DNA binding protein [Methylovirgula sp.]|uniref:UdgX family uracil-DNA binding protein n=1 Tax=Methylovirgula sp. TaxID=1978224 RepID=UPI0030768635